MLVSGPCGKRFTATESSLGMDTLSFCIYRIIPACKSLWHQWDKAVEFGMVLILVPVLFIVNFLTKQTFDRECIQLQLSGT